MHLKVSIFIIGIQARSTISVHVHPSLELSLKGFRLGVVVPGVVWSSPSTAVFKLNV